MTRQSRNARSSGRAALTVVALAAALVSAAPAHASSTSTVSVAIKDFTYGPPVVTVPVGTTVTWTNHDEESHTVTAATGSFGSAGLSNEETFAQTFAHPGTYQYFCALHPKMRATVVVK